MDHINAVGALNDPTRRRAYEIVCEHDAPVGRDEVAAQLGVGRTLAAFHLDKLVDAGLVEAVFGRRGGRAGGPGAGRPAKLYRRCGESVRVELPPRAYAAAGALLAEALDVAGADLTLHAVAEQHGRRLGRLHAGAGRPAEDVGAHMCDVLREQGYEPVADGDRIALRNCPFHTLADEFPPLICGMNLALLTGLADAAGWPVAARMRPQPGRCCVALEPVTD